MCTGKHEQGTGTHMVATSKLASQMTYPTPKLSQKSRGKLASCSRSKSAQICTCTGKHAQGTGTHVYAHHSS